MLVHQGGLLAGKAFSLCAEMYLQLLFERNVTLFSLKPEKVKTQFKKYFREIELTPIPEEQNTYEVTFKK